MKLLLSILIFIVIVIFGIVICLCQDYIFEKYDVTTANEILVFTIFTPIVSGVIIYVIYYFINGGL